MKTLNDETVVGEKWKISVQRSNGLSILVSAQRWPIKADIELWHLSVENCDNLVAMFKKIADEIRSVKEQKYRSEGSW